MTKVAGLILVLAWLALPGCASTLDVSVRGIVVDRSADQDSLDYHLRATDRDWSVGLAREIEAWRREATAPIKGTAVVGLLWKGLDHAAPVQEVPFGDAGFVATFHEEDVAGFEGVQVILKSPGHAPVEHVFPALAGWRQSHFDVAFLARVKPDQK